MVLIDTSRGLRQQIYLQYFLAYFGIIASSCHVCTLKDDLARGVRSSSSTN